jgi:tRNA (guanine37-N1)-methyltransferase
VPRLIVPGPGGVPFTQALAHELAEEPWLAFACGRYEGLDERVYEHAAERMPVTIVSLGDYVLNGGEVAVLAIVEAVARLLPGVVGNAESLVEESHEDGLLEYPVYTKPSVWNDDGTSREVPPILLSGNHAAIAAWRHQQRLDRTAARRPDLLHASSALAGAEGVTLATATPADAPELLTLQRAAFVREIEAHGNACFPALTEELDDVVAGLVDWSTLVARSGGRLVASGRGRLLDDGSWEVSRVMVAPDLVGRGIGRALVAAVEGLAPAGATAYRLMVAAGADRTRRMYRKAGYRESREPSTVEGAVVMTKARKREKG